MSTDSLSLESLRGRREAILALATRRHASGVRVFGSVVRDEAGPASDVDFLVDFDAEASLLDQVGLIQDLQELLATRVDVISSGGLRPHHESILRDAVAL